MKRRHKPPKPQPAHARQPKRAPRIHVDCPSGKITYKKRQHAESDSARVSRERGARMHTYRCPHCGRWHLTSKEQR